MSRAATPALLAVFAIALAVGGASGRAAAACITGVTEQATVTGEVVSTSIARGTGVYVTLRADSGSEAEVLFWGRDPTNTFPGGVENTVEDAWVGELPRGGGRYAITGDPGDPPGDVLTVSLCATGAGVTELAAPTASSTSSEAPVLTDDADAGSAAPVVVPLVIGVALLVAVAVLLLRRDRPVP